MIWSAKAKRPNVRICGNCQADWAVPPRLRGKEWERSRKLHSTQQTYFAWIIRRSRDC